MIPCEDNPNDNMQGYLLQGHPTGILTKVCQKFLVLEARTQTQVSKELREAADRSVQNATII